MDEYFADLEVFFTPEGSVDVTPSDSRRITDNKTVSVKRPRKNPRLPILIVNFRLQIFNLWHRTTSTLAACVVFLSKSRVGVVQNLLLAEYRAAERGDEDTVVWVAKHKIGDKRPATLVLDLKTTRWMDRYVLTSREFRDDTIYFLFLANSYLQLRLRLPNVKCDNFFVTTNGTPIRKVFEIINNECRRRDIRLPDNADGTAGAPLRVSGSLIRKELETAGKEHGRAVRCDVASALQHTEDTAKQYYHVSSAAD